ncbi:DNA-binding transcriptional MocR family regulator [Neorhizobium alkalisoli]|uniref:DNA-binding transcriptional MocR family regulator n=2 Tax=Neorhizobium alkalisoli TaxID=528178 RepID=A0A561QVE1_9HYPH|nr:DNA-binding transcriptional MocR family regulator [Neorhizobium alkalisoli]
MVHGAVRITMDNSAQAKRPEVETGDETGAGQSRTALVMTTIRQRIAGRSLTPGAKLPSVRSLAASLKVSVSTVVDAYDRLVAEGAITSRPGSGFYVANQTAPLALSEIGPKLDRAVDPFWVSRQSLEAAENDLKPGCGWLPPSWLPEDAIRRSLRTLSRGDATALSDYGPPLGLSPLRRLISRRMAEHGIEAPPNQIMLTESGTQAIDLLCRFLLETGDTVLIDDPCYFNFQALLRAHRAKIVSVPYTPNGPDLDLFAKTLAEHRPRLYITNSGIHNPTGATLSPVTAHRVLKLAEQFSLTIIEDDIFADFEHVAAPRLAAFDGLDRVIHIGSFSKTLSASARCGFIAAKPDWIEGLTDLKIATTFGGGRLAAELVHDVLSDGGYRKHLDVLRARLSRATVEVSGKLQKLGITPWIEPQAGMFLWCRLPDGLDAGEIARAALAKNIVLAPGNVFSASQSFGGFMRFNVSQSLDDRLFDMLREALARR